ncbi:hypothetical protein [Streptomyces atriruber]|uniref:hypothetical protein n=1 Tax=Streptomyces atriruber TaxID=545121 RepID=UPI0006E1B91C|nr:hypothetical protein [Streptomyces atriruber]
MDHAAQSQAIALLLGHAETSGEIDALARIARRAGFPWTCPACQLDNYPNKQACCGKRRPADGLAA